MKLHNIELRSVKTHYSFSRRITTTDDRENWDSHRRWDTWQAGVVTWRRCQEIKRQWEPLMSDSDTSHRWFCQAKSSPSDGSDGHDLITCWICTIGSPLKKNWPLDTPSGEKLDIRTSNEWKKDCSIDITHSMPNILLERHHQEPKGRRSMPPCGIIGRITGSFDDNSADEDHLTLKTKDKKSPRGKSRVNPSC